VKMFLHTHLISSHNDVNNTGNVKLIICVLGFFHNKMIFELVIELVAVAIEIELINKIIY
jgi:hypothetical protein